MLRFGTPLYYEDQITSVLKACMIIHNICIEDGGDEKEYLAMDEDEANTEIVNNSN